MNFSKLIKDFILTNNYNLNENSIFIKLLKVENKKEIEDWLIDYDKIKTFCKEKEYNPLKLYYFIKNYIHSLLYEKEKLIVLNSNNRQTLDYYFYLSLLIQDNPNLVNYSYSFEFIKQIYSNINNVNNDNNKYKKLILSKIILELIANYKQSNEYDDYDDNDDKEIEKIEYEMNEIIKYNINNFNKEFNLKWKEEDIKYKKINIIYLEIIKSLIKNNKFENMNIYII